MDAPRTQGTSLAASPVPHTNCAACAPPKLSNCAVRAPPMLTNSVAGKWFGAPFGFSFPGECPNIGGRTGSIYQHWRGALEASTGQGLGIRLVNSVEGGSLRNAKPKTCAPQAFQTSCGPVAPSASFRSRFGSRVLAIMPFTLDGNRGKDRTASMFTGCAWLTLRLKPCRTTG